MLTRFASAGANDPHCKVICTDHYEHIYIEKVHPDPANSDGYRAKCDFCRFAGTLWMHQDGYPLNYVTPVTSLEEGCLYVFDSYANKVKAKCTGFQPIGGGQDSPAPQPKTGVEDTLPLWFGVMVVSAAAYVMTSKKKFF